MLRKILQVTLVFVFILGVGHAKEPQAKPFIFGMLLVGPHNDRGWSQAHYDAGLYVERKLPGVKMLYLDKVNPADRPGLTLPQWVDDLVAKGARLIIANSDDMKDGVREAAKQHPKIIFIVRGLATGTISVFQGPLDYQDGKPFLLVGETATDEKIWYMEQLLSGIEGQSSAK